MAPSAVGPAAERIALHRAGNFLQAVFYDWRFTRFDHMVKDVVHAHNVTIFTVGDCDFAEKQRLRFPQGKPDHIKHMLLAYNASSVALGSLFDLTKKLLQGTCTMIFEENLQIDPRHLTVTRRDEAGQDMGDAPWFHKVIRVTLGYNENYIIDLTGAQFGIPNPVTPAEEYYMTYTVQLPTKLLQFGREASLLAPLVTGAQRLSSYADFGAFRTESEMRARFKAAIENWQASQTDNMPRELTALVYSDEETWVKGSRSLFAVIQKALRVLNLNIKHGKYVIDHSNPNPESPVLEATEPEHALLPAADANLDDGIPASLPPLPGLGGDSDAILCGHDVPDV